jgi:hypothetical protein
VSKRTRQYIKTTHKIGFERGESWVYFIALNGRVYIDRCDRDGTPELRADQVRTLMRWMQAAIRTKGKTKKGAVK